MTEELYELGPMEHTDPITFYVGDYVVYEEKKFDHPINGFSTELHIRKACNKCEVNGVVQSSSRDGLVILG